ncbi:hypothetical protein DFH08DRAFT_900405 [Mycena albidolilacea]|uniref:Uncharacterized protein n=1 Tax=Mycena albidolilacea TaxID=1033008 RepID=A0AAD7EB75_9AGAR|nr:hypothetical protein DFH08DRAFT_900405 [Mycena albidolilacea]
MRSSAIPSLDMESVHLHLSDRQDSVPLSETHLICLTMVESFCIPLSPMPLMKGLLASIFNYRLGYAPTRPYAWRWTTPIAFLVFLVATIILALINVPLSAYTIVTEATFTPNASLPALALHGLVPSILQESSYSGSFSPQTLTPGQIIRLNGAIHSYNITGAYNGFNTSQPVTSFLYYNNPLSDSCDITNMTIRAKKSERSQGSVQITCWTPAIYIMTFDVNLPSEFASTDDIRIASLGMFQNELDLSWSSMRLAIDLSGLQAVPANASVTGFEITVRPCCDCHGNADATWNTGIFSLDYPPCSEAPASFLSFESYVYLNDLPFPTWNNTDFFLAEWNMFNGTSFAGLNTVLHNFFQAMYHTIRLDLGVSQPNQIYMSADMYNRSISTVYIPGLFYEGGPEEAFANSSLRYSSNLTILWTAEQQDVVRVPIMSYVRTMPCLKPLGAAITSVFVSTFAMVSVLWQVFSFIAAALSDKGNNKEIESLRETVEQMRQDLNNLKHGLIVDDEKSEDMNPL